MRRQLWNEIQDISISIVEPWCFFGDFNNVISSEDRIWGLPVRSSEYLDLQNMMEMTGIFPCQMEGDRFTWNNRHCHGRIYSKIDHVLGNVAWFQKFDQHRVEVLEAQISDHNLLLISLNVSLPKRKFQFKFLNYLT